MNCKPGDFAQIVKTSPNHSEHLGKVVVVKALVGKGRHGPCWSYAPTLYSGPKRDVITAVEDVALRPIRDPGEDAKDETLTWLPVPSAGVRHRSAA